MRNIDLPDSLKALEDLSATKLPMSVAMEVVRARKTIESLIADFENVRNDTVSRLQSYEKDGEVVTEDITFEHPNFIETRNALTELAGVEVEDISLRLTLYVRNSDAGEEYAWTPDFKHIIEDFDANIIYGLMHFLDVKYED